MLWLSDRYILKIERLTENEISIKTWSVFGFHQTKTYPKNILESTKFHKGQANFYSTPTVNAPWIQLKTPRGKLLIMDIQGEF